MKTRVADRTAKRLAGCARLALFALALLLLVAIGLSLWVTRRQALAMVYPSRNPAGRQPEAVGIQNYRVVEFQAADGLSLRGWYVPTQNGATIILVHGHGGNRGNQLSDGGLLVEQGYGILLYDARNCGESDGNISTFGYLEANDVRGALDFVLAQEGIDPQRIGILGHSMGGAATLLAAPRLPEVRAFVVESTYTSVEDNARENLESLVGLPSFPFAPLVLFWGKWETGVNPDQIRPIDAIAAISPRPVLIVHGDQDGTMLVKNAYKLYQAALQPKELLILPQVGHCCLPEKGGKEYRQKIIEFFGKYLLR